MRISAAKITAASRPILYDFNVTRGLERVPYRAFLHECRRYPESAAGVASLVRQLTANRPVGGSSKRRLQAERYASGSPLRRNCSSRTIAHPILRPLFTASCRTHPLNACIVLDSNQELMSK